MIIEISGLPEGQKIKHINVDIKFEDDGSATVNSTVDGKETDKSFNETPVNEEPLSVDTVQALGTGTDDLITAPLIDEEREHKDIPPEMTDMEF